MANDHYTRGYDPQPTQRVGSTDLKNEFQAVEGGFDSIQADTSRTLRQVGGAEVAPMPNAISRAMKLLSFDAAGNPEMVAGGGRYRGDWVTGAAYVVSDYFRDAVTKNIYSTVIAHTAGVLATDISAGRVQLAINVADVEIAKTAAEAAAVESGVQAGLATTNGATQVALAADQVALAADQVALAAAQAGIATTQAGLATTNGAAQVALATTQAGIATTQAGIATTGAGTATTQAGIATAQAGTATTQAGIATTQAGIATTKAAEAAASAASIAGGPVASVNTKTGVVTLNAADVGAQATLVSGTNIKTINGSSLLGSGNIPINSPGMVLLATINPTASAANIDFLNVFSAAYDNYLIIGSGIKLNLTTELNFRFATSGVVNTDAAYSVQTDSLSSGSSSTSVAFGPSILTGGTGGGFVIDIQNVNSSSSLKSGFARSEAETSAGQYRYVAQGFAYKTAAIVSGFRLYTSNTFQASGTVRVYGYVNS